MKRVYKYEVALDDYLELQMPDEAKILHVDIQGGPTVGGRSCCIWALVDPSRPESKRRFRLAGTGHPINENVLRHIGSWQQSGGALVWHLFELLGIEE